MNFSYREALTFVLQTDCMLVSKMYWQMAWHAIAGVCVFTW